jgi:hypothetical protein
MDPASAQVPPQKILQTESASQPKASEHKRHAALLEVGPVHGSCHSQIEWQQKLLHEIW